MKEYEVRTTPNGELRFLVEGDKPRIDAKAIMFNSWSCDLGGFRERMLPGSVELEDDLLALFDHDTSMVIGRTSAGTMTTTQDGSGVAFTAFPPDTTWARDMRVSMERGDIKGCSYRMLPIEDKWYVENGQVCRDIIKAQVSELTITSMPAYPATTAEARDRAAAVRASVFADTLAESDADHMASWGRFYALEYALDSTIYDALADGDRAKADTAFSDFAAAGSAWLAEHIARFGTRYPMADMVEELYSLRERIGHARASEDTDTADSEGASRSASDNEDGASSAHSVPEKYIPGIGFKKTKE